MPCDLSASHDFKKKRNEFSSYKMFLTTLCGKTKTTRTGLVGHVHLAGWCGTTATSTHWSLNGLYRSLAMHQYRVRMRTYVYVTVYVDNTLLTYAKIVQSDGRDSFADEVFRKHTFVLTGRKKYWHTFGAPLYLKNFRDKYISLEKKYTTSNVILHLN